MVKVKPSSKMTIYSAYSSKYSIWSILREIIIEFPESHELGLRLCKRNLKAMYRQSILGFTWALFPPIITGLLWILLRQNNVMSFGDTGISYPVYVLIGTMLWQIFSESVIAPIRNVSANQNLLIKINIPREGLLLSGLYEVIFNTLIKILLIIAIIVFFKVEVDFSILLTPLGILTIIVFGFGIGLILTPIGMLYSDIQKGLIVILPILMYMTPVIYPQPKIGIFSVIMQFNPMASFLTITRNLFTSVFIPSWNEYIFYLIISVAILIIALIIYRIAMPMIIERVGS